MTPDPGVPTARPQFPALDTLRAVGAIAVLTTHVAFQSGGYLRNGVVGALLARLDVGVAVFFVLSGFLLGRTFLVAAALDAPIPSTGRYYWKRFLRIYPVYAVCVILALLVLPENGYGGASQWLRTLTMTDLFSARQLPAGLTQMWSLSVEATFYAALPLAMIPMLGRRPRLRPRRVVAFLGAGTALAIWWNAGLGSVVDGHTAGVPELWLPAHLTWFLVGIGLALVHILTESGSTSPAVRHLTSLGAMPGVCWAMAGGLLLASATPLGGPIQLVVATQSQTVFKHLVYAVIAALMVLPGIFADPRGRYARAMSAGWARHLGHISYSIFCLHLVLVHVARDLLGLELFRGGGLELWTVTLALTLLGAELLYRFVELPAMRLKNLHWRLRRSAEPTSSAVHETSTR